MRHFGKRAFALLLALMLCLSLFPSALAEDAGSIATEDAPEQEVTIAPADEGNIIPAEEGTIAPADEGSIRPAEEGDALPRTDDTQGEETSGQCGDNLTWSFDEATGTLIITGSGDMWNWEFRFAPPWFSLRESIKSVELPSGLTSIGNCAFTNFSKLTFVDIPASVTVIGDYLFRGCTELQEVYFGGTVAAWKALQASYEETQFTVHCADGDLLPVTAEQCGHDLTWSFDDATGTLTIIGSGDMWNYEHRYDSSDPNVPWGSLHSSIKSVELPVGLTGIGSYAFEGCSGLTSIVIPGSVTSIGSGAFFGCSGLTGVTIPEGVVSIGDSAFSNCSGLTDVTIPSSVTSIGYCAFYNCSGLTSIEIPGSVTSIGSGAFQRCSGLTSVTIPGSVTSIGVWAFYNCSGLTSVTIPGSVTSIGDRVFSGCSGLINVTIPSSVTSIGDSAFSGCRSLTSVTIPGSVTSIGGGAFSGCRSLTSVTIPGSVTSIGNYAFSGCSGLTGVKISGGVTSIGSSAFSGCSGLNSVEIPGSVKTIGMYTFRNCSGLTSVVAREGVEGIMDSVFQSCSKLSSVTLPGSLTYLGSGVFSSCPELQEVYFGGTVAAWKALQASYEQTQFTVHCADGDFLPLIAEQCGFGLTWSFDEASGTLTITGSGDMWDWESSSAVPWYSLCASIKSVELPRGLTSIGNYTFSSCSELAGVTIPAGVNRIGNYAFSGCSGLTGVTIPSSVTRIGHYAFEGCSGLTSVTIPEDVTSIGDCAFSSCNGLNSVEIPGSVKTIGANALSNCHGLTSVVVREGVESIMGGAFVACYELSIVTLPASLTYLGSDSVFYLSDKLQDVYFGGTVAAWKALQVSYGRTKITVHCADGDLLPVTAEQCGEDLTWSFDETSGTLAITGSGDMWDWLTWNGLRASIKKVALPQGLTSIGGYAFSNCRGLTSIEIPGSVTSIGSSAFSHCSGLTSVTLPASATEINTNAFSDCENLKDIYYAGTYEAWCWLNLRYDRNSVTVHCADRCIRAGGDQPRQCGDDLFWSLENGILTITGTGSTWNFASYYSSSNSDLSIAPWYEQGDMITQIRLTEGVTGIGENAFGIYMNNRDVQMSCENLVSIELPETLRRIGNSAFTGCGLTELTLPEGLEIIGSYAFYRAEIRSLTVPASVTQIGDYAFRSSSLSEIRFLGDAPVIDGGAFSEITAVAYYPQNNPTWTQAVRKNYCGNITWKPYLTTDSTFRLGDATACAGRGFTVELALDENPGAMGISFQLDYDSSVMEFVGAEDGVLTGWTVNVKKNILVWDDDREHRDTGCLLKRNSG